MPRPVAYDRQTFNNPNPLARFAHRSRFRHALALMERNAGRGARVLDFGAGTGAFLHRLGQIRPDLERIAFEPFMPIRYPGMLRETAMENLASGSIDAICAFEVFEHLSEPFLHDFFSQASRILKPRGKIIASVPIMQGLALPVKELSRSLLFHRRSDHSTGELMSGLLGRPIERADDLLTSHKGFSHRALYNKLSQRFSLVDGFCSPFSAMPWWANSQVFWVFDRPAQSEGPPL
jgi:SAM-dependent methyltransferase